MDQADRRIEERQPPDLGRRDGEDAPHQDLLDVLAALGRLIDDEHGRRGGHGVHDPDDGFLGDGGLPRAARREERCAAQREGERVPVGRLALDRMARQERDRDAERRHLGEGQIDEDHAARQHVEPEIHMDRGQHEAGEQRNPQELHHKLLEAPRPAGFWIARLGLGGPSPRAALRLALRPRDGLQRAPPHAPQRAPPSARARRRTLTSNSEG